MEGSTGAGRRLPPTSGGPGGQGWPLHSAHFAAPTYGRPSAHRVRAGATQGGRAKAGMRRSLLLIALLLIALTIAGVMAGTGSASAADPAAADPDCSVYSQPCIFLEASPGGSTSLAPPGRTSAMSMSGRASRICRTSATRCRSTSFEAPQQPGPALSRRLQAFNDAYGVKLLTSTDPGFTCPIGDCTLTYHLDAPTTGLAVDGLTEFRVRHRGHSPRGRCDRRHAVATWSPEVEAPPA